jgi:hypothetical protein
MYAFSSALFSEHPSLCYFMLPFHQNPLVALSRYHLQSPCFFHVHAPLCSMAPLSLLFPAEMIFPLPCLTVVFVILSLPASFHYFSAVRMLSFHFFASFSLSADSPFLPRIYSPRWLSAAYHHLTRAFQALPQ